MSPGVALRHQARDLGAALEARIDEVLELRERVPIGREMLGLAPHRLLPRDAEPGEVLVDRLLEFGTAARRVDVLDAQQEAAGQRARHLEVGQRRERMPEMQVAVRARRETEYRGAHRLTSPVRERI